MQQLNFDAGLDELYPVAKCPEGEEVSSDAVVTVEAIWQAEQEVALLSSVVSCLEVACKLLHVVLVASGRGAKPGTVAALAEDVGYALSMARAQAKKARKALKELSGG